MGVTKWFESHAYLPHRIKGNTQSKNVGGMQSSHICMRKQMWFHAKDKLNLTTITAWLYIQYLSTFFQQQLYVCVHISSLWYHLNIFYTLTTLLQNLFRAHFIVSATFNGEDNLMLLWFKNQTDFNEEGRCVYLVFNLVQASTVMTLMFDNEIGEYICRTILNDGSAHNRQRNVWNCRNLYSIHIFAGLMGDYSTLVNKGQE